MNGISHVKTLKTMRKTQHPNCAAPAIAILETYIRYNVADARSDFAEGAFGSVQNACGQRAEEAIVGVIVNIRTTTTLNRTRCANCATYKSSVHLSLKKTRARVSPKPKPRPKPRLRRTD